MDTIRIFLASSQELAADRLAFKDYLGTLNTHYNKLGISLEPILWEHFIDAMSRTRLQEEYNKAIRESDIFLMLFFTKVGKYTLEEFETAFAAFQENNRPLVYTYFKNADAKTGDLNKEDQNSLSAFLEKLSALGHYPTRYTNADKLFLHFREQLDSLFLGRLFDSLKNRTTGIPQCLSASQPGVSADFMGRDLELADMQSRLQAHPLLLINGEGGMGKTSLAAKFLHLHWSEYEHFAWFFCENGIIDQLISLAPVLGLEQNAYEREEVFLADLKTKMENLPGEKLLILDNANDPAQIQEFLAAFGGLHQWKMIFTSRCEKLLADAEEYRLQHLEPEAARQLFKKQYDEKTEAFELLLNRLLAAIGYNTLLIEIFSKNQKELAAMDENLEQLVQELEENGLYLGDRSFEIHTPYTGHVKKQAATTDDILNILYNLARLTEAERKLLVNLALLPAESWPVTLLADALAETGQRELARHLKRLAQKGWLNSDGKTYRLNQVAQTIILSKNRETLMEDSRELIDRLNDKLESDSYFLTRLTLEKARPFAEMARSLLLHIKEDGFDMALLAFYLGEFYRFTGNLSAAIKNLEAAMAIFKNIDLENYGICLSRLGGIFQQQGDFTQALSFFQLQNTLAKELFEANPNSEALKNGLAISYEKLGSIFQQQGDFSQALSFFQLRSQLGKELFEANPNSEALKNGLAIAYEKLGEIFQQQGDFSQALSFFQLDLNLTKELYEANPQSEALKNGLAIAYSKLGSIFQQQGDFKQALSFFQLDLNLTKELFEANPNSEALKNGLAISYAKLGYIFQQQGDFNQALTFFELYNQLKKELYEANPQSVGLYNGLGVSYSKLAGLYLEMDEPGKARPLLEQCEAIWMVLVERAGIPEYQKNLDWARKRLKGLG